MDVLPERITCDYKSHSERFQSSNSDYSNQYCSIYTKRMGLLTPVLILRITQKWNNLYEILKLRDLNDYNDDCVIIGTIFKDQKLKPSVLKQLAEAEQLVPQPVAKRPDLCDDSDKIFLEDESQRYELLGNIDKDVVTGITCALLGSEIGKGQFRVTEVCFAGVTNFIERPMLEEDVFVVYISGLDLSHSEKSSLALKVFFNWIAGSFGDMESLQIAKIARLIIAGNSISTEIGVKVQTSNVAKQVDNVKLLDKVLVELVQVIDVDLMPGENDPTNYVLPQRCMHHCMFPESAPYKSLNCVPNPYECDLNGVRILGTAGRPVRDIMRFSGLEKSLDVLENCIKWGHLAPTAPDTLGCYPFYDKDPFIINDCPHVLFAGNQEKFETKMCKVAGGNNKVRLISVPEFAKTKTVAVLNLKNFDCFSVQF